jgi:hypothetical protein
MHCYWHAELHRFAQSECLANLSAEGISNIEHGISNDEVFPLCPIASAFDIPCSIFDILFLLHAGFQIIADISQKVTVQIRVPKQNHLMNSRIG